MNKIKLYLEVVSNKNIFYKSLKIAVIVGTILNIINQGDKLFALDFENIDFLKSFLTYIVPFLVSTYAAISVKMEFHIGEVVAFDADLKCKDCGSIVKVIKNEFVPVCENCHEKTKWMIV